MNLDYFNAFNKVLRSRITDPASIEEKNAILDKVFPDIPDNLLVREIMQSVDTMTVEEFDNRTSGFLTMVADLLSKSIDKQEAKTK